MLNDSIVLNSKLENEPTPTELLLSQFLAFPNGIMITGINTTRRYVPVYWKDEQSNPLKDGREYETDTNRESYIPGYTFIIENLLKELQEHKDSGKTELSALDCSNFIIKIKASIDNMIASAKAEGINQYLSPQILLFRTQFTEMFEIPTFIEDLFGSLLSELYDAEPLQCPIRPIMGISTDEMKKFIKQITLNAVSAELDQLILAKAAADSSNPDYAEMAATIAQKHKEAAEISLKIPNSPLIEASK